MNSFSTPRLLKSSRAPKCGLRSEGHIGYRLVANQAGTLLIGLTANDSGGVFSRELVPIARLRDCASAVPAGQAFASKAFAKAFSGKSTNNAGFLSAAFRAEGLLEPAPNAPNMHIMAGDWSAWEQALLALPGEPLAEAETSNAPATTQPPASAPEHKKVGKGKRQPDTTTASLPETSGEQYANPG